MSRRGSAGGRWLGPGLVARSYELWVPVPVGAPRQRLSKRAEIKMAEQKEMELTSSHKHIKNTTTFGTSLTEYLLDTGWRSHTTKATRKGTTLPGSDGGAQDCCLTYSRKEIPANIVRGYRKQNISLGCAMPAILFSPRKRSQPELCADPKEPWVQKLMRRLDKPSAPRKPAQDCKKNKGATKSGKKGKGSKGCKRTETSKGP